MNKQSWEKLPKTADVSTTIEVTILEQDQPIIRGDSPLFECIPVAPIDGNIVEDQLDEKSLHACNIIDNNNDMIHSNKEDIDSYSTDSEKIHGTTYYHGVNTGDSYVTGARASQ